MHPLQELTYPFCAALVGQSLCHQFLPADHLLQQGVGEHIVEAEV